MRSKDGLRAAVLLVVCACMPSIARYARSTIAIDPRIVTVAPGEALVFSVSGGDGHYHFAFSGGAAASGADATLDTTGHYRAGATGLVVDTIVVTDDSGDAASAQVSLSAALALSSTTLSPAPGQSVTLVAAGGKAPYVFLLNANPSGGAIDAQTGTYTAGTTGMVSDIVQVSDAAGQAKQLTLAVGAALSAALTSPSIVSGLLNPLVASGGLAPYHFDFAFKGNHSGGTVNQANGDYLPGNNVLTTDTLQITDATGATATASVHLPALTLAVGAVGTSDGFAGDGACAAANLVGNGRRSLAIFAPDNDVTTIDFSQGATPVVKQEFPLAAGAPIVDWAVADVNGDGRDDLLIGAQGDDDANSVLVSFTNADGSLGNAISISPTGLVEAVAGGSGYAVFAFGFPSIPPHGPTNTIGGDARGIAEALWDTASNAFAPLACVAACGSSVTSLAVGDFDGDGWDDLAWGNNDNNVYYLLGTNTGFPAAPPLMTSVATGSDVVLNLKAVPLLLAADPEDGPAPTGQSALLVTLGPSAANATHHALARCPSDAGDCSTGLVVADDSALTARLSALTSIVLPPNSFTPDSSPVFLGWDGAHAPLAVADTPVGASDALAPSPLPAPQSDFAIGCIAALDANGDGVNDIAMVGAVVPKTTVLLGEGDGTFGRRPRFLGVSVGPDAIADIDGDGNSDLVVQDALGTMRVYLGQDHELGLVSTAQPLPQASSFYSLGHFLDATDFSLFLADPSGAFWIVPVSSQGVLSAAQSLLVDTSSPLFSPRWSAGHMGGGADFVGATGASGWTILRRTSDTTAHAVAVAGITDLPGQSADSTCAYDTLDLNGDGFDDLVALCPTTTGALEDVACIEENLSVVVDGAPTYPTWLELNCDEHNDSAEPTIFEAGRDAGVAYFMRSNLGYTSGVSDEDTTIFAVSASGVTVQTVAVNVVAGAVVHLDASAATGLALLDADDFLIHLYAQANGSFSEIQTAPAEQLSPGAFSLNFLNVAGASDDILTGGDTTFGFPAFYQSTILTRDTDGIYR